MKYIVILIAYLVASDFLIPSVMAKPFVVNQLPKGARVTIPQPATTVVNLNEEVWIGATDSHQTIKIIAINLASSDRIKIEFVDEKMQYSNYYLTKNSPIMIRLKTLEKVLLRAKQSGSRFGKARIKLQSNKPLFIQRGQKTISATVNRN